MFNEDEIMSREESIKWVQKAINGIKSALKDYNKSWVTKALIRSEYLDDINWEEVPSSIQLELRIVQENARSFLDGDIFFGYDEDDPEEDFDFREHD